MGKDHCSSLNPWKTITMQRQLMFWTILLDLLCFSFMTLASSDMIVKDQQISDGQTVVSAGGMFEMGFFSPGNSKNRYVGIWYKIIPVPTLVWVANRERPVTDLTGILMINRKGDLVIMDAKGNYIWTGYGCGSGTNTSAKLLDNGNLILGEGNLDMNGSVSWQSFDFPIDTYIPGMKFGRNRKSKQNRLITSWTSLEDPSPGLFSVGLDPNVTTQFFVWNQGTIYWTSGEWNGHSFSLTPEFGFNSFFNFSYVVTEEEEFLTYSFNHGSIVSRFVLEFTGEMKQLVWLEETEDWNVVWSQPSDMCDIFSICGAYGSCNINGLPRCKCLRGFEPVSPKDWELNNWSSGCKRTKKLECGNPNGFLQFRRMKLPDQMLNVSCTGKDCEAICMKNCSCIAYALGNRDRCLLWDKELIGIREDGEEDLFICLAASELKKAKSRIWIIIVVAVASILLLLGFFMFYLRRRKLKRRGYAREGQDQILKAIGTNMGHARKFNDANTFEGDTNDSDLQLFSFVGIEAATANFSAANKLGEGGFGPVYKGKLLDGREIAVKILSVRSRQGVEEFKNEIVVIAKLQHTNLVRLFGCCIQTEEKMLIYEYMPNNSLDSFFFDPTKRAILDWGKRENIIEGIAQVVTCHPSTLWMEFSQPSLMCSALESYY